MKYYYAEVTVSFTSKEAGEPSYTSTEVYSYIVQANNKKEGKAEAKTNALLDFKNDWGDVIIHKVEFDTFHQTEEGARAN